MLQAIQSKDDSRYLWIPQGNLLKIDCPEGWKKNQPCFRSVQGSIWPWMLWMPWSIPGHPRVTQGSLDTKAIFLMDEGEEGKDDEVEGEAA